MLRFTCLALLFAATSAVAHPVMDAIKATEGDPLDRLNYRIVQTRTTDKKVVTQVARHNAGAPAGQRWTLESVNGAAPTSKEVAKFLESKSQKEPPLAKLIDPASLAPVDGGAAPKRWRFRYRSGMEVAGMDLDAFHGQLVLNDGGDLAATDIGLNEPIRLKLVLKMSRIDDHIEYARLPGGGVGPLMTETRLLGSMAGMTISETIRTKYEFSR